MSEEKVDDAIMAALRDPKTRMQALKLERLFVGFLKSTE